MTTVVFLYMKNKYSMKLKEKNILGYDTFEIYANILGKDLNELYFSYKGKHLDLQNSSEFSLKINKDIIKINVFTLTKNKNNKEPFGITCPRCKNLALLKINEDKISLDSCIKKHYYQDLTIEEFTLSQKIDEFVKCDFCGNLKNYYDQFYVCSCGKLICPFCYLSHDFTHTIISYNNRFYQCIKHSYEFISYCLNCNLNLCSLCETQHFKHKIIYYKSIIPNDKKKMEIKREFKDFEIRMKLFQKEIIKLNEIYSDFLNNINKSIDEYIKLNEDMFNSIDNMKNYETIKNVLHFKLKKLNKDIYIILNEQDTKLKFRYLLEIFDNPKNEMSMTYKINKSNSDGKIRLFGEKFVKNNKNNCILLIKGKKSELIEFYDIDKKSINNLVKVDLIEKRKIINMSYMFSECNNLYNLDLSKFDASCVNNISGMFSDCNLLDNIPNDIIKMNVSNIVNMNYLFYNCENLKSLPDISKWETMNVISINHIFNKCSKLIQLPDISRWNTSKIREFSAIFNECSSLVNLPDISKWDTRNAIVMNGMFNKCTNLIQLPDISKWNTGNVKDMSAMFQSCSSLKAIPNITKWNTSNLINISGIFNKCNLLISLPDISHWNISNVIDISAVFQNCSNLSILPNISKWDTSKVKKMSYIFNECISLESIPDISIWKTNNVIEMVGIFSNCIKLRKLPDISKWNTEKVKNIGHLFNGCQSLKAIPDISKWKTNQVTYMSSMFQNCSSLTSLPDISKWNISKVTDISYLFNKCSKLNKLPDISKWNTENVINMSYLFNECPLLTNLKNIISKWNTTNLINKKNIFNEYSKGESNIIDKEENIKLELQNEEPNNALKNNNENIIEEKDKKDNIHKI